VVVERGDIWWVDLDEPSGSAPGYRRPLLIVQADSFNRSRIRTVIGLVVTSNLGLLGAPGNVLLPMSATGLPRDSVANASQVVTVDRDLLLDRSGKLPATVMASVEHGLRLILDL
jgi:mRNA interferase MazF